MFKNIYNEIFESLNEKTGNTSKAQDLENRYRAKPYHKEYFGVFIAVLALSLLINAISFFTGGYILNDFFMSVFGNPVASIIVSVIMLGIWEFLKRVVWSVYWKNKIVYRIASNMLWIGLILGIGSNLLSLFGTKETIKDATYAPTLVNRDSLVNEYNVKLNYWRDQLATIESQTDSKGTVFYRLHDDMEHARLKIDSIEQKMEYAISNADYVNNNQEFAERRRVNAQGWKIALVVFFLDASLIWCMWYIEYYHFRSYISLKFNTKEEFEQYLIENGYDMDESGTIDENERSEYFKDQENGRTFYRNGKPILPGK